jgi:hypothetical protein
MNHITLVSVTTEANVPISTATDAGSIHVAPIGKGWTDQQLQGLIRRFASSIGHNHGLFDEI